MYVSLIGQRVLIKGCKVITKPELYEKDEIKFKVIVKIDIYKIVAPKAIKHLIDTLFEFPNNYELDIKGLFINDSFDIKYIDSVLVITKSDLNIKDSDFLTFRYTQTDESDIASRASELTNNLDNFALPFPKCHISVVNYKPSYDIYVEKYDDFCKLWLCINPELIAYVEFKVGTKDCGIMTKNIKHNINVDIKNRNLLETELFDAISLTCLYFVRLYLKREEVEVVATKRYRGSMDLKKAKSIMKDSSDVIYRIMWAEKIKKIYPDYEPPKTGIKRKVLFRKEHKRNYTTTNPRYAKVVAFCASDPKNRVPVKAYIAKNTFFTNKHVFEIVNRK